jgi:mRNA interferase MazF
MSLNGTIKSGEKIDYYNAEHYADPTAYEALKNIETEKKMEFKRDFKRGDIIYVKRIADRNTGEYSEIGKPAVIVSNNAENERSEYITVCYIIKNNYTGLKTHIEIELNGRISVCACESVQNISKDRYNGHAGSVGTEKMKDIDGALMYVLGLDDVEPVEPVESVEECKEVLPVSENTEINSELIRLETERDLFKGLYEKLLMQMIGGK